MKKRIYRKNADALEGEEDEEVHEKLQATYENVVEDYHKLVTAALGKR